MSRCGTGAQGRQAHPLSVVGAPHAGALGDGLALRQQGAGVDAVGAAAEGGAPPGGLRLGGHQAKQRRRRSLRGQQGLLVSTMPWSYM